MINHLRQKACTHLEYVLEKLPENLPAEMGDLKSEFSTLKDKLEVIHRDLTSKETIDVSAYHTMIDHIKTLAPSLLQVRLAYHRACRLYNKPYKKVSPEFSAFPVLLHALYLHVEKLKDIKAELNKELQELEEIRQQKIFEKFLAETPAHFTNMRDILSKIYQNDEKNASYLRTLAIIIKCEAVRTHISTLADVVGTARSAVVTKLNSEDLPEGLLWHPENFTTKADARITLIGLVHQYIRFFNTANEHRLLKEFCTMSSDGTCFEGTMDTLLNWMIKKKLFIDPKEGDKKSTAPELPSKEGDEKSTAPELPSKEGDEKSTAPELPPEKALHDFIKENLSMKNDQLLKEKFFLTHLEKLCSEKIEQLGNKIEKMDDNQIYEFLITGLDNENLKICVYHYALETLRIIDSINSLDTAWENSLLTESTTRNAKPCRIM